MAEEDCRASGWEGPRRPRRCASLQPEPRAPGRPVDAASQLSSVSPTSAGGGRGREEGQGCAEAHPLRQEAR